MYFFSKNFSVTAGSVQSEGNFITRWQIGTLCQPPGK